MSEEKKCINPWLGLLCIILICLIMTLGVFLQCRGDSQKKGKMGSMNHNASVHAAWQAEQFNTQSTENTIIF